MGKLAVANLGVTIASLIVYYSHVKYVWCLHRQNWLSICFWRN
uniref:Uncharacterized protein n=1 Tax=Arundo donax TaxID=35708 RepID=A0A0A9DLH4_ARUDO